MALGKGVLADGRVANAFEGSCLFEKKAERKRAARHGDSQKWVRKCCSSLPNSARSDKTDRVGIHKCLYVWLVGSKIEHKSSKCSVTGCPENKNMYVV